MSVSVGILSTVLSETYSNNPHVCSVLTVFLVRMSQSIFRTDLQDRFYNDLGLMTILGIKALGLYNSCFHKVRFSIILYSWNLTWSIVLIQAARTHAVCKYVCVRGQSSNKGVAERKLFWWLILPLQTDELIIRIFHNSVMNFSYFSLKYMKVIKDWSISIYHSSDYIINLCATFLI